MKTRLISYLVAFVLIFPAIAMGYPKPKIVQKKNQWTLKVNYSAPEQISLRLPNEKKPQRFWYIILSVTNETSLDEVDFYPLCELITDTFQVIPADRHVPVEVFNAVRKKHQGSYPFLESLDFKDHRVSRGKDNTRDFVIIWPDFDLKAKKISLFVGGLSNETAVVENPKFKDENGNPKKIFLQKTLLLEYAVAGDERLRDTLKVNQINQTWVMR